MGGEGGESERGRGRVSDLRGRRENRGGEGSLSVRKDTEIYWARLLVRKV